MCDLDGRGVRCIWVGGFGGFCGLLALCEAGGELAAGT